MRQLLAWIPPCSQITLRFSATVESGKENLPPICRVVSFTNTVTVFFKERDGTRWMDAACIAATKSMNETTDEYRAAQPQPKLWSPVLFVSGSFTPAAPLSR